MLHMYMASVMESSDEEDVQTALILGLILRRKRRKSAARGKKRMWVRSLLQMRTRQGTYNNLIQEMRLGDCESHFSFLRMSRETFDVIFCLAVFERLRSNIAQGRKLSHSFDQLLQEVFIHFCTRLHFN